MRTCGRNRQLFDRHHWKLVELARKKFAEFARNCAKCLRANDQGPKSSLPAKPHLAFRPTNVRGRCQSRGANTQIESRRQLPNRPHHQCQTVQLRGGRALSAIFGRPAFRRAERACARAPCAGTRAGALPGRALSDGLYAMASAGRRSCLTKGSHDELGCAEVSPSGAGALTRGASLCVKGVGRARGWRCSRSRRSQAHGLLTTSLGRSWASALLGTRRSTGGRPRSGVRSGVRG